MFFNLKDSKTKDPSELYIKQGMDAVDTMKAAIKKSRENQPPRGGRGSARVGKGNARQTASRTDGDYPMMEYSNSTGAPKATRVCRTPIIIVKRVRNLETDEEKMQIAFKKRNRWKYGIFPSTTIYQSRNIASLADLGAMITSENAKQVVLFLEALEAENMDIITEARSTSQLGWATDKTSCRALAAMCSSMLSGA